MLDPHLLRNDIEAVGKALARRGYELDTERFRSLEWRRKKVQVSTEKLQAKRNRQSKQIGKAKAAGEDIEPLLEQVASLGEKLKSRQADLDALQEELNEFLREVPNIPHSSVPAGAKEEDNKEIRRWGVLSPMDFVPKDHTSLGEALNLLDFEAATRIAGSRFVVMQGALARLHRALIQFMLDVHVNEHEYLEVNVPYLVNPDSLFGTGQLPKFADDQFHVEKQDLYLIPTAEVPVTNIARDMIFGNAEIPLKYVCHSPCFRSEAGSYGQDTRGMIRQHQFEKVELVQVVRPDDSYQVLEELTDHAETILQRLQLPYRVVTLCGGDLGFSAAKTYDLEVWLPSQRRYREISSCSNFEDFQARRMSARWRNPATGKPELVHTLNGSGLAVGRTLIAIMENFQDGDGRIHIPEVLHPYMGGITVIPADQSDSRASGNL
ncbi:MAG: serine--tRNA ligase [Gammaproteobacteria bacterium]|nr:serine--tRNA ligase [Gammaproteobacteria bacterium]